MVDSHCSAETSQVLPRTSTLIFLETIQNVLPSRKCLKKRCKNLVSIFLHQFLPRCLHNRIIGHCNPNHARNETDLNPPRNRCVSLCFRTRVSRGTLSFLQHCGSTASPWLACSTCVMEDRRSARKLINPQPSCFCNEND